MEVYKLGKTIENQVIDIQLALQQLNETRDALKSSLKRRREISIAKNTHYKEIDTAGLFIDGNQNEFDASIVDLMERSRIVKKKGLKRALDIHEKVLQWKSTNLERLLRIR